MQSFMGLVQLPLDLGAISGQLESSIITLLSGSYISRVMNISDKIPNGNDDLIQKLHCFVRKNPVLCGTIEVYYPTIEFFHAPCDK